MEFNHVSVLREESIELLQVRCGGVYADGTLGGGGHTEKILQENDSCRVVGIDRDADAICAAKKRLSAFGGRVTFVHDNFKNIKEAYAKGGE